MKIQRIKFLTKILLVLLISRQVFSKAIVTQEKASTHLRWNIFAPKDQIVIQKNGRKVSIKLLDQTLINKISDGLQKIGLEKNYIESISEIKINKESKVGSIEVVTAGEQVELFSFYRDEDNKYILDYWRDQDVETHSSSNGKEPVVVISKEEKTKSPSQKSPKENINQNRRPSSVEKTKIKFTSSKKEKDFRDFRYGAAMIWDYEPLLPILERQISLESKTAEFFYPIKDRSFKDNDKEAHLQLAINFYRKKKWGLMYKALKLFQEKYGLKNHAELIEYLKANTLIREQFAKGHRNPSKEGIVIYENLIEMTENYSLKMGLYKYLIEYYLRNKNYISALQRAKEAYVDSRERSDYVELREQSKNILHILSKLGQIEKLQKVLKDKMIIKFVPDGQRLAYEIYSLLKIGKTQDVWKLYEKKKPSFGGMVDGTILYNVGEAYFRDAKYKEAIELFDQFIAGFSFYRESGYARLRLALSFDLLDRDPKQVQELYKNAINRSATKDSLFEAKLRYVAFSSLRKKKPTEQDIEERSFIESKEKLTGNLKQLLWIVRLRTLILDKDFKKALSYLSAIPIQSIQPLYRRIFEGDGAEIVYGVLDQFYNKSDYSYVVRVWEKYKDRYVDKVAQDPYVNYIVGMSYLNLNLFDGFDKELAKFEKLQGGPVRTFPIWFERKKLQKRKTFIQELKLMRNIKLGNHSLALENVKVLESFKDYSKIDYWKGYIYFGKKDYENAIKHFEVFIAKDQVKSNLTVFEVAELLRSYTDSIYYLGQLDRFFNVAQAILNDTKNVGLKNNYMISVRERIHYLQMEILFSKGKKEDILSIESMASKFLSDYKKSVHKERVKYMLGSVLVKNKKEKEGKKILNSLLMSDVTSGHIKAMVRSELALIKIKEIKI